MWDKSQKTGQMVYCIIGGAGTCIEKAYVCSVGNVETEGNVIYLPIYLCYLLKETKIEQMIIDLDMIGHNLSPMPFPSVFAVLCVQR